MTDAPSRESLAQIAGRNTQFGNFVSDLDESAQTGCGVHKEAPRFFQRGFGLTFQDIANEASGETEVVEEIADASANWARHDCGVTSGDGSQGEAVEPIVKFEKRSDSRLRFGPESEWRRT